MTITPAAPLGTTSRQRPPPRARRSWRPGAATVAVGTWVVGYPLALLLVQALDTDPLRARGAVLPVAIGVLGGAVLFAAALRRVTETLVGVAAGGYAVWVGLVLAQSSYGTPFGGSGLRGDSARLTAMATRWSTTWLPVDAFIPSIPTEYPPLFPYLVGRASVLLDRPAWALIGDAEGVTISLAVLTAFVLWRRLVPAPVALALCVLGPAAFSEPRKSYEIITLSVFVPWVLATFTDRPRARGGLHWAVGGAIGGLIVVTYQGYLLFSAVGLLGILVSSWRGSAGRTRYALHVLGVLVSALVVSAWYVGPYLYALLALGGNRVSDFYISPTIAGTPIQLPFLQPSVYGVLQLIGLVGLIWYRSRVWWAQPLLWLVVGTYAYRLLYLGVFVVNGHTGYLHYTVRLLAYLLMSAGVLTLVQAAPGLWPRLALRPPRALPVVGTAVLLTAVGMACWNTWIPSPPGLKDVSRRGAPGPNFAAYAHAEPLPDGSRPRFAPRQLQVQWFPIEPILRVIREQLGPDARPVTLSYDERFFSYRAFPGYVSVHRLAANTFAKWDERHAELARLAATTDPAAFAAASADTRFGGIDVFVLRSNARGWTWRDLTFSPAQFDPRYWHVENRLPQKTVVVIRRS